jgi:hypothetical protein
MTHLDTRHDDWTDTFWWWDVRYDIDLENFGGEPVPAPLHELAAGKTTVRCADEQAAAALAWARAQPYWPTEPPVYETSAAPASSSRGDTCRSGGQRRARPR